MNDPKRNWHTGVFFGVHYDLHARKDDTRLGTDLTREHLKAELAKVKPDFVQCDCKGHPGYTSWPTAVGTPSPGIVNDALRIHRDVTNELGIPLIAHYSGVWNALAVEQHPDWACVPPDAATGVKNDYRHGFTCNLSAYTDDLMIPQLIEVIDKYDIDGFWVDGENWASRPCYCQRCRCEFTKRTGIASAPLDSAAANWRQWADFHRQLFAEHVARYTTAVHARKPSCTVCSNWIFTFGHPDPITVPVDYLSGDFVHKWSLQASLLSSRYMSALGLSWDLMGWAFSSGGEPEDAWTFKHTPAMCQEAATVISLGGAFSLYDLPQRTGHLNSWHQDAIADVARFVRARQPWCQNTETVPQAVILHNVDHYYSHINENLAIGTWSAQYQIEGALHSLLANHVSVDILNDTALAERVHEYPLVIVPEQTHVSPELIKLLEQYVANGGALLASGVDAVRDFGAIAGVEACGDASQMTAFVEVERAVTPIAGVWQRADVVDATVVASVLAENDPAFNDALMPALTVRSYGKGRIGLFTGPVFANYFQTHYPRTRDLIGLAVQALEPKLLVAVDGPATVHVVLRSQPGRIIAHLVNVSSSNPLGLNATLVEDVSPSGPMTLRFNLTHKPRAVYNAPSMEGLSWKMQDGALTVSITNVGIMDSVVIEL